VEPSENIKEGLKHLGYGLAWMGFWIGLGLFNFQGKGCSSGSPTVEMVREYVK